MWIIRAKLPSQMRPLASKAIDEFMNNQQKTDSAITAAKESWDNNQKYVSAETYWNESLNKNTITELTTAEELVVECGDPQNTIC